MNEFTNVAQGLVRAKTVPGQALPVNGQKSGNNLPPVIEAAKSQPSKGVDQAIMQEHMQAAVAQMNEYIQSTQRDLSFSYDPNSGETVVKVLDRSTQEVIRQIPDEIFLRLAQRLDPEDPVQLFSAQA